MDHPTPQAAGRPWWRWSPLLAWAGVLCVVPDPRPLGAPEWLVDLLVSATGAGEPAARAVAAVTLRGGGAAVLGALVVIALGTGKWRRAAALVVSPGLAVVTAWIGLGYFPIAVQLQLVAAGALLGALAGMALGRSRAAAAVLVAAVAGLVAWGTATGIGDDLDAAARAVGRHVLAGAGEVPDGDAAFPRLLARAFAFAAANSPDGDAVVANRAAILALAVVLGEEKLAGVAGRRIDPARVPEAEALRARVTLQGRKDWPRHFWVSAGLTLLSDAERSIAVGLAKELMDATPGGTGFSFADLAADAAGNRFTRAATRDAVAAAAMQARLAAGVQPADLCPELRDLPEGIDREVMQSEYGGLGGPRVRALVDDIERRLDACGALR